jgi:hypothetical protein
MQRVEPWVRGSGVWCVNFGLEPAYATRGTLGWLSGGVVCELWAGARVCNAWNPGFAEAEAEAEAEAVAQAQTEAEVLTRGGSRAILMSVIGTNLVSTIIIID